MAFGYLKDMNSRKCTDLLSRMLQKAWPFLTWKPWPGLEKAWPLLHVEDKDIDEVLLKHLLTWQTWPGFLEFFGKSFFFHMPSGVLHS